MRRKRDNPVIWESMDNWAARLFVGLSRGDDPVWRTSDVEDIVAAEREEDTGDPSSSFIVQRGIYQHGDGHIVREDSVQVVIFKDPNEAAPIFAQRMRRLAEVLAARLGQDEVIVEVSHNGATEFVAGMDRARDVRPLPVPESGARRRGRRRAAG